MEEFINCPGLNHIAKNIIVCLNGVDINACCHVNESWRDFINHQKIWEQNLRKKLDNAARQIPDIYENLKRCKNLVKFSKMSALKRSYGEETLDNLDFNDFEEVQSRLLKWQKLEKRKIRSIGFSARDLKKEHLPGKK